MIAAQHEGLAAPAFEGFGSITLLSGFSGAYVAVLRDGRGSAFVRKAAADPTRNATLKRQAARQNWLSGILADNARAPAVLEEGEAGGCYYFDMPFVHARDAVSFLSYASFEQVEAFAAQIARLLAVLAETALDPAEARGPAKPLLLAKLDEIAARTEGRHAAVLAPLAEAAAALDEAAISRSPTGQHGDLTFENILVDRRGVLWLIDSIDSPFDHYWIDWSKLFQECEGRWHGHRGRSLSSSVNLFLKRRWLEAAAAQDTAYPRLHYLLLGLTFARILPYASRAEDTQFVSERVAAFGRLALADVKRTAS